MDAHDALTAIQTAVRDLAAAVASEHGIDLGDSLFVVAPKVRTNWLGWFVPNSWTTGPAGARFNEIAVSAEFLGREPEDVACTVIHELAHLAAFQRGIKDTSRQGRWHNRRFGELALDFGLTISEPHEPYGIQTTGIKPSTQSRYAEQLTALADALVIYRELPTRSPVEVEDPPEQVTSIEEPRSVQRRFVRATCGCSIGRGRVRQISVPASSWEPDSIECRLCGETFVETEQEGTA